MNAKEAKKVLGIMKAQGVKVVFGDGKGHYFKTRNLAMLAVEKADEVEEHRIAEVKATAGVKAETEEETDKTE